MTFKGNGSKDIEEYYELKVVFLDRQWLFILHCMF
jgi:hypothetical protein